MTLKRGTENGMEYTKNMQNDILIHIINEHPSFAPVRWRRGRAFASHAGDRGSIPGRDRPKS